MSSPAIIALAFAPGLFWLWFFYKRDKIEPEPKHLIVKTFFWGMAAVIPAIFLETPFKGMAGGLALTVVAAPIFEEYFKYFAVRRTIYAHDEFDEPMDGIVYAAAAALGFASLENAFFLFSAYSRGGESLVWSTFTIRALLSVPGHVMFSAMWGYALGVAKFSPGVNKRKVIAGGVALAMLLHGLFNLLVTTQPLVSIGLLAFLYFGWRAVNKKISAALADSPHHPGTAASAILRDG